MHACLTTVNVPFRCTAITSSHSCSVMLKTMRSRRMPAQQTTMSRRPKLSMAVCTIRSPPSIVATDSVHATAVPPASRISPTTTSAIDWSNPVPSTLTPGSTTTTLAPSSAISFAIPRPTPRPEPVTIATFPSRLLGIVSESSIFDSSGISSFPDIPSFRHSYHHCSTHAVIPACIPSFRPAYRHSGESRNPVSFTARYPSQQQRSECPPFAEMTS